VRLLFTGRVIRTKGTRDAISALGLARDLPVVLDIVGDGFDRAACEKLAAELGLTDRVRFHGRVPRDQVDDFYQAADIFVFPSYREPGGSVVFEAMSHGLPLIVSDRGGPGHMADESCGIRLHPVTTGQYATDLAAAITRLVRDPALRRTLGAGARDRAQRIALWDSKVTRLEEIHAQMLANSSLADALGS
jgi:glycosyltransferase involved in cell wall biosynthesis